MKIPVAPTAMLGLTLLSASAGPAADAVRGDFAIRSLPASCRLLPAELRDREATLLADLRTRIVAATALEDGYALQLMPDDANLRLAAEVMVVERQCCPFLQFGLALAQESRALVLEMRGPAGSRELLDIVLKLSDLTPAPISSVAPRPE